MITPLKLSYVVTKLAKSAKNEFRTLEFAETVLDEATKGDWNTPQGIALFLCQVHHESCGFTRLEEGLSYSADRLIQVWPNRFNEINAQKYARNPKALACKVYGGRMGNASEPSTDGWEYRGSGLLQHTGKFEHDRIKKACGLSGSELRDPKNVVSIVKAAASYISYRGVSEALKCGDIVTTTKKINGGLVGLKDRRILYIRYFSALSNDVPAQYKAEAKEVTKREELTKTDAGSIVASATTISSGTITVTPLIQTTNWAWWIFVGITLVGVAITIYTVYKSNQSKAILEKEELENKETKQ
jgi:putative chitinase